MATYAKYRRAVLDLSGNVVVSTTVTVTDEATGLLATLFTGRTGTGKSNPFTSDATTGVIEFYVVGGAYKIDVVKGTDYNETFRYEANGTMAEKDLNYVFTANQSLVNNTNGVASWSVSNNSSGTSALAMFTATNGTLIAQIGAAGASYTAVPILQNRGFFDVAGNVPLVINNETAQPLIFGTSSTERARILLGLMVGTTTDPGANNIGMPTGGIIKWNNTDTLTHSAGLLTVSGKFAVAGTTASTSSVTGALTVAGGLGVAGALNVGAAATITGALTLSAVGLVYDGKTLTGSTGTLKMVLSASPTFTGTLTAAIVAINAGNNTPLVVTADTFNFTTFATSTNSGYTGFTLNAPNGSGTIYSGQVLYSYTEMIFQGPNAGVIKFGISNAASGGSLVEAFRVQSDSTVRFAGPSFTASATTATILGSLGPAGAHTTVQTWFTIVDNGGNTRYIPAF